MRPTKLVISAFGPYKNEVEVDFEKLNNSSIYLITGDTGSGKTTIFDALVFALYGSASGNIRENSALRSKYSSDDVKTFVTLSFINNGVNYTVTRNPEYLRPSKRGDGLTKQSAEASLEFDDTIIVGYKAVNEKIEQIIGINKEQYYQIAMIAQGEFLKLLLADTSERMKIFRNIFQTNNFKKLQENLKSEELKTKKDYENLKNSVLQYLNDTITSDIVILNMINNLKENNAITTISECVNLIKDSNDVNNNSIKRNKLEVETLTKELATLDALLGKAELLTKAQVELDKINKFNEANGTKLKLLKTSYSDLKIKFDDLDILKIEVSTEKEKLKRIQNIQKELNNNKKQLTNFESMEKQALLKQVNLVKNKIKYELELKDFENLKDPIIFEERIKNINSEIKKNNIAKQKYHEYNELVKVLEVEENEYVILNDKYVLTNQNYLDEESLFFNNQAGIIAAKLKEGEPCLVCGSTTHPLKAKSISGVKTEKELQTLKIEVENLRNKVSIKSEKVADVRSQVNTMQKLIAINIEEINNQGEGLQTELNLNSAELNLIKVNLIRKNEVVKMLEQLKTQLEVIDNELYDINNNVITKVALIKQLETDIATIDEVDSEDINKKEKYIMYIIKEYNEAKNNFENLNEQIKRNDTLKVSLSEQLKETEVLNMELLLTNKKEIVLKIKELNTIYDKINLELKNNEKVISSVVKGNEEIRLVEEKYRWIKSLSDTANGNVSKKERIMLEAYVQMSYFDQVINRANTRFMIMSGGQFELVRRTETGGLRSQSGLELDVIDHYNGTTRSVKTLSGGESFMASLSLALGLSDEIQASSGGINVESMFVDEGFGTLSEDALNNAIKILNSLAQSNKMIGIISHVNELKESIDAQICVTKTVDNGSKIEILL